MKKHASVWAALLGLFALVSTVAPLRAASFDQLIVFGDSLSDNGNLAEAAGPGVLAARNYDPFRVTDGPSTAPSTAITGVAVEQLNSLLGLPPLTPALLGGTNYAWAFAKTGFQSFDPATLTTPGTGLQVASYLTAHPTASPSSLFVLWAGANDLLAGTTPGAIELAGRVAIANLSAQLGALLNAGAQNIAWFNLPDLSFTPAGAASGLLASALHDASVQFRSDWNTTLQRYQSLYPNAKLTGVDVFGTFLSITTNPAAYGFTHVTPPAQGLAVNPDDFLFWDSLHPTTRGHQVLAGVAFQALQAVPEPSTYGVFGATALLAALVFRRNRQAQRCSPARGMG